MKPSFKYVFLTSTLVATLIWLTACGEQKDKKARPGRSPITNVSGSAQRDVQVTPTSVYGATIQGSDFKFVIDSMDISESQANGIDEVPIVVSTSGSFMGPSSAGAEAIEIVSAHTSQNGGIYDGAVMLSNNSYISHMSLCTGVDCEVYYMSAIVVLNKPNGSYEVRQYGLRKQKGYPIFVYKNETNVSHHIEELIPMIEGSYSTELQNMP
ncbi:MAG: hypothetical protein BroJett040_19170 [Oligoflexia bacterium]|nr:MAG: hypothetical protein BroJett040_19170 [Oligoflexia bacterium]